LIYLNLPDIARRDDAAGPKAPGAAVVRTETNVGHIGAGIYWSAGHEGEWDGYYEVSRNGHAIGKIRTGLYYFDISENWNAGGEYAVCAIDRNGRRSPVTRAVAIENMPAIYSALGNHWDKQGQNGWRAEYSYNLEEFSPMRWIPPAKNPQADFGGTPNQPGGIEGYWEGGICARAGRGWQQASPDVFCVRSFEFPCGGRVRVTGRALKEWYHKDECADAGVFIMVNNTQVWPKSGNAPVKKGECHGADHDIMLDVKSGDIIRFVVDKGIPAEETGAQWEKNANLIGWIPQIAYICEKAQTEDRSVIRINCGSETAQTDGEGRLWLSDTDFAGGEKRRFEKFENMPADGGQLYATARTGGDFSYSVALKPGLYTIRLGFAELEYVYAGEREMTIEINGETKTWDFDILGQRGKPGQKKHLVYNYVVPGGDSRINIRLKADIGEAILNTIEIAPADNEVLRINCGGEEPFVDWAGEVWVSDRYFEGGECIEDFGQVTQTTPTIYDKELYRTARCGDDIIYRIPVGDGIYSVQLKFAEMWTEARDRPMEIQINDRTAKSGFDPATAAESFRMAIDQRFEGICPVDGFITVAVKATGNHPAILQAIALD